MSLVGIEDKIRKDMESMRENYRYRDQMHLHMDLRNHSDYFSIMEGFNAMRFRINGTVYVGQAAKYMFTLKSPFMLFEVEGKDREWTKYKK